MQAVTKDIDGFAERTGVPAAEITKILVLIDTGFQVERLSACAETVQLGLGRESTEFDNQ
jgi:hypothetical protein